LISGARGRCECGGHRKRGDSWRCRTEGFCFDPGVQGGLARGLAGSQRCGGTPPPKKHGTCLGPSLPTWAPPCQPGATPRPKPRARHPAARASPPKPRQAVKIGDRPGAARPTAVVTRKCPAPEPRASAGFSLPQPRTSAPDRPYLGHAGDEDSQQVLVWEDHPWTVAVLFSAPQKGDVCDQLHQPIVYKRGSELQVTSHDITQCHHVPCAACRGGDRGWGWAA
jgi:hypothetical protein